MSATGIVAYATYVPRHRVQRTELGATLGIAAGRGTRVVSSFDEDSTTMGVEAAAALLREGRERGVAPGPSGLYFATTSPAYLDKTNAAAIHAALALPPEVFAADLAGSARSGIAAFHAAAAASGLAVASDVRTGRPGSADERSGGDAAAAFLFGDPADAVAKLVAQRSLTTEVLDRWREPGAASAEQWEERFGQDAYRPLVKRAASEVLADGGVEQADHVVLVSPNPGVVKQGTKTVTGTASTVGCPTGHAGAADPWIGLADALDRADPGESILVLSVVDGCDAVLFRTTGRLAHARQARSVAEQTAAGRDVPYATYLSWRGLLDKEPPRRPEPDRPAGPPAARSTSWKFSFTGNACRGCGFVHLPPSRVCKRCGSVDEMDPRPLAGISGTVATYTVDRLAFSPSPPLTDAVVDFDGGGRYTLELADGESDALRVGTRVGLTFRKLFTAGGVHNYFWKARVLDEPDAVARDDRAVAVGGQR